MIRWLKFHIGRTLGTHLDTDPACAHYQPTREGTRLDRDCRGWSCQRCDSPAPKW